MTVLETYLPITLIALSLCGCANVCDRMCDAQADLLEGCFETWESSWEELSYANREVFVARCYGVWGDALEALDSAIGIDPGVERVDHFRAEALKALGRGEAGAGKPADPD